MPRLSIEYVKKNRKSRLVEEPLLTDLYDTIEAQQQEIEQHIKWNEEHTKARVALSGEIELCKFLLHNHGKDNPKLSEAVQNILFENDRLQMELAKMSGTLLAISKAALEVSKGDE